MRFSRFVNTTPAAPAREFLTAAGYSGCCFFSFLHSPTLHFCVLLNLVLFSYILVRESLHSFCNLVNEIFLAHFCVWPLSTWMCWFSRLICANAFRFLSTWRRFLCNRTDEFPTDSTHIYMNIWLVTTRLYLSNSQLYIFFSFISFTRFFFVYSVYELNTMRVYIGFIMYMVFFLLFILSIIIYRNSFKNYFFFHFTEHWLAIASTRSLISGFLIDP